MLNTVALDIVCNIFINISSKGPAQRERIELYSEQEHDSCDEIKLFIYGQVVNAMGAMWHFYGYQDYPASIPAFVLSKCKLHSNWILLSYLARSQTYKFITTDQPSWKTSSMLIF
jgi:hypothetical protein